MANDPVHWFNRAKDLQFTADKLFNIAIPAIEKHKLAQQISTASDAMEASRLISPINLLYGFALENGLKSAYIHANQDFDYMDKKKLGAIWTHNLRYLYNLIPGSIVLEDWQLNLLDELTILIEGQGRYPVGKPPKQGDIKEKNAHPISDRELKAFIEHCLNSIRQFIDKSFSVKYKSPLGPTVKILTDGVFDPTEFLKAAGLTVFKGPKEETLKDRFNK
jgi:hypothetical protein